MSSGSDNEEDSPSGSAKRSSLRPLVLDDTKDGDATGAPISEDSATAPDDTMGSGRSVARTNGVVVEVTARHQSERSRPSEGHWFFSYRIEIRNEGAQPVQLLSRRWLIRDAEGREEEVQGPGVIGEQPLLAPGECFLYCSGCPLETPFGSMRGHFEMIGEDGVTFQAQVARFELAEPYAIN